MNTELPSPWHRIALTIAGDQNSGTAAERQRVQLLTFSLADVFLQSTPGATARSRERFYMLAGLNADGGTPIRHRL